MDPDHIAVLTHARDRWFEQAHYLIHPLVRLWRQRGLRVGTRRGIGFDHPAALLFPHIDLTVRPPEYEAYLQHHPCVVNRRVLDVSKSRWTVLQVGRDSSYTGPVIVKTNRNHGGFPEARLVASPLQRFRQRVRSLFRRARGLGIAWESIQWLDTGSYQVLGSLRDVPKGAFENDNLLVQQFLPEREGARYAIRYAYVLGRREITLRLVSKAPVVKFANAEAREEVDSPPELAPLRRRLGLDYGKIDFVMPEGRFVPLDVNPTPVEPLHGFGQRVSSHLADGIDDLLESCTGASPPPARDVGKSSACR
jgi:hypothetical protein